MEENFTIKNTNIGEELLLKLLMDFENQIEIKDEESEKKHTFYAYGEKYDINIKISNKNTNQENSDFNYIDIEKNIIIKLEIIKNDKHKITFVKEVKLTQNGINNKERIMILEELEKTIIKELNLTKKDGLVLSEPFIEYENKINIVNAVTNSDLYKKTSKGFKKFVKNIFNPELKENAKKTLEKNGLDPQKITEKINQKLEFSIPKIKLFLSKDGRQYLCYKNEWYIKTNDEIFYNNNVYNLTNKEFYEIIESEKVSFTTLEEYLNESEKNIEIAKENLKNIDEKDTSTLMIEKKIKSERNRLNKIREKLLNISERYFTNLEKITNFSEKELYQLAIEISKFLCEEQQKNQEQKIIDEILKDLEKEKRDILQRILKKTN